VHQFLLGPMAGIGEVAIRIAHHLLGTVIVVLDGDVDRHVRRLPTSSVSTVARDAATPEGHFLRRPNGYL
jgi:hypothetical protein